MHWGMPPVPDMLNWQHEPVALAPGDKYDRDGCFQDVQWMMMACYHLFIQVIYVSKIVVMTALLSVKSSVWLPVMMVFTLKQGCVLTTPPEGIMHFRDPKVRVHEDGFWWMVIAPGRR